MPLQATSGAASYDAFGGGVAAVPNYIEDVFSTWLYTGNGSTQTINNGIDLAGKGGLVWIKRRDSTNWHQLQDTSRGAGYSLNSNSTAAQGLLDDIGSFNSNGFSLVSGVSNFNGSGATYASWTFREQPKFFDVVTYTGNGVNDRQIAHNLESAPGFIVVKRTDNVGEWVVYHRNLGRGQYVYLNSTDSAQPGTFWGTAEPTSTVFRVSANSRVNANGGTYVAYLFAHDAGGFGLSGSDNVISCGSFTSNISGVDVNLGYEPQWVMVKATGAVGLGWYIWDNMRGFPVTTNGVTLQANVSDAEGTTGWISPTATGFRLNSGQLSTGNDFIYIAIRRGPMRTPTTGTSVFGMDTLGGTSPNPPAYNSGFVADMMFRKNKTSTFDWDLASRLTAARLNPNLTNAETVEGAENWAYQNGYGTSTGVATEVQGWLFRRAPGYFDEVCYTGNGTDNRAVAHNLAVAPELVIVKCRSNGADPWAVLQTGIPTLLRLNATIAGGDPAGQFGNSTTMVYQAPTSTNLFLAAGGLVNETARTYVAYLFASCPGVSKVGSFTGTGATQVINCGFTGGARFVLIKATSTTGNWLVWDSARGIVAGNDPYLALNSTAAEVTNTDWVDTAASGFELSNNAGNLANSNGVSYIYLAIA